MPKSLLISDGCPRRWSLAAGLRHEGILAVTRMMTTTVTTMPILCCSYIYILFITFYNYGDSDFSCWYD